MDAPRTTRSLQPAETPSSPASAMLLLCLLLLRTVLLLLGDGATYGILRTMDSGARFADALPWANVFIVAVDLITLWVLSTVLRRKGRTLRSLFERFRASDVGWGLLLFVILIAGFLAATYIGNLVAYQGAPPASAAGTATVPLWLALWSITIMPITVAIAEESLYRGYLQPRLIQRYGLVAGLLITAGFFGLQHVALSLTSPQAVAARVVTTALAGLLLGALFLWRKRLQQVVIGHWLLDVGGLGLPLLLAAI